MNTKTNDWKKYCRVFLVFVMGSIYFSEISAQALPASSYQQFSGNGTGKLIHGPFNYYGKIPVLSAFTFEYVWGKNGDNHYKIASIDTGVGQATDDMIEMNFADQNPANIQDIYKYNASFALINPSDILYEGTMTGNCVAGCGVQIPPPPQPDAVFVLRSFKLEYMRDDHHILGLGLYVDKLDGQLAVYLHDKRYDDLFYYSVQYVYLPRSLFIEIDKLSGTDDGGHTVPPLRIANGIPLIRGFNFVYKGDDHHIRKLSVDLKTNGKAELAYKDKRAVHDYDYDVWYAVLPRP